MKILRAHGQRTVKYILKNYIAVTKGWDRLTHNILFNKIFPLKQTNNEISLVIFEKKMTQKKIIFFAKIKA